MISTAPAWMSTVTRVWTHGPWQPELENRQYLLTVSASCSMSIWRLQNQVHFSVRTLNYVSTTEFPVLTKNKTTEWSLETVFHQMGKLRSRISNWSRQMSQLILDHKESIIPPQYLGLWDWLFWQSGTLGPCLSFSFYCLFVERELCQGRISHIIGLMMKHFSGRFMSIQLARQNPHFVTHKGSPWVRQTAAHMLLDQLATAELPGASQVRLGHTCGLGLQVSHNCLYCLNCSSRRPEKTASSWIQSCSPTDEKET